MWGVPLGLLYNNAWEWVIHKYVLHGWGRARESLWSFHWYEHHRNARRGPMSDPGYERSVFGWHAQGREALGLVIAGLVHLPLLKRYPVFTVTVLASQLNYWRVHRKAHRDPAWAREHLAWHYDHHMGPDQDANWGVTFPWADWVMGTRKPWAHTEAERVAEAAKAKKRAARSGQPLTVNEAA